MSGSPQMVLPTSPEGPIPVAAYVRMSTEHQQYSTENQLDRIKEYATKRGMAIVRVSRTRVKAASVFVAARACAG